MRDAICTIAQPMKAKLRATMTTDAISPGEGIVDIPRQIHARAAQAFGVAPTVRLPGEGLDFNILC
jgi:hypothetical protein